MTETLTIRSDSGVTLTVEPSNWLTDGLFVMLRGNSAHFPADDARKLAEWLAARFPTPATPVLEPGKVYRLLPGAKYTNGTPASVASTGATRVRLDEMPNGDGNVWVRPLDGPGPGRRSERLVDPKYLAPLAELKVGDIVALKPGAETANGGEVYFADDVTRVKVESGPDGDGDYLVRNVDGSGITYGGGDTQYVAREYLGDPEPEAPAERQGATPTFTVIDEAIDFAPPKSESLTAIPKVLNPTRVAAVEKALELLFTQAEDVTVDDILSVAAYVADEIDIVHDDEADA